MIPLLNSPEFVEWHVRCYQKHMLERFELYIFNDGFTFDDQKRLSGMNVRQEIATSCITAQQKYPTVKLNCINIPPNIHAANSLDAKRCFETTQYIYDNYIQNSSNSTLTLFHDSDIFLFKATSIWKQILNSKIAFIPQERGDNVLYMWNGFIVFNHELLKNEEKLSFEGGVVEGQSTDVGGKTHYWLLRLKQKCIQQERSAVAQTFIVCAHTYLSQYIPQISIYSKEFLNAIPNTFLDKKQHEFLVEDMTLLGRPWGQFLGQNFEWVHLRGAGNWQGFDQEIINQRKKNAFNLLLN